MTGSKNSNGSLLIVEDDPVLQGLLSQHLQLMGYQVLVAGSAEAMRKTLNNKEVDLVILDLKLPDADGMDLLKEWKESCSVIVLTAHGSVQNAVQAIKAGAAEYLLKPINLEDLNLVITRVLETQRLRKDNWFLKQQAKTQQGRLMIGDSPALHQLRSMIDAVAKFDMTVLITGESGVGKELVAREIHDASSRSSNNFVAIDCCALQDKLFESELFGHERGAFTGADRQKPGLIEMAKNGTLFLDEIGEVEPTIQAKLLRVLETGQFRRLGGTKELSANVRFITATNRDLESLSREGKFRSDLYFRLSGFSLHVPRLCERRQDIPTLVEHFINSHDFSPRAAKTIKPAALKALIAYDWPGNIRELKNTIERAIIVSQQETEIGLEHLSFGRSSGQNGLPLQFDHEPTLQEFEREYLRYLLEKYSGQRGKIASVLGISERNIYRLLHKYGEEK